MNTPESQDPRDLRDPDRLLARGLRATTPAFEGRFDDLRRRLATEPPRRSLLGRIIGLARGHPAWSVSAAAAVGAIAVVLVQTGGPHGDAAPVDETGWYAEVVALDDSLRGALVLTDLDALETLSLMPVDSSGGGS